MRPRFSNAPTIGIDSLPSLKAGIPVLSGVSRSTGFAPLKDRHGLGLAGLWSCVLYPRLGRVPPGTGFCYGLRL